MEWSCAFFWRQWTTAEWIFSLSSQHTVCVCTTTAVQVGLCCSSFLVLTLVMKACDRFHFHSHRWGVCQREASSIFTMLSPACNCVLCCRFVFIPTTYREKLPPSGASCCCAQFCFAAHFMLLSFFFLFSTTHLSNWSSLCDSHLSNSVLSDSQLSNSATLTPWLSPQRLSSQQLCSQQLNSATFTSATSNSHCKFLSLFSRSPSLIKQSMQCKKLGGGIEEENS